MTRNGVKRKLIPEKLSIQHQLEILCFLCVNNYVEFDSTFNNNVGLMHVQEHELTTPFSLGFGVSSMV